jgi:hypothetical protein
LIFFVQTESDKYQKFAWIGCKKRVQLIISQRVGMGAVTLLTVFFLTTFFTSADESSHSYEDKEHVILWVNKVGPYHNPQETYKFHSLPYCLPDNPPAGREHAVIWDGLGSILEGNNLEDSRVPLSFKTNIDHQVLCKKTLSQEDAETFEHAVKNQYWYQLYLGKLFNHFSVLKSNSDLQMIYQFGAWLVQKLMVIPNLLFSHIKVSRFCTMVIESLKLP